MDREGIVVLDAGENPAPTAYALHAA